MSDSPILYVFVDGAMVPANPYWARKAGEAFKPGTRYELVEHQERSMASHRAFFASVNEAYQNLPEEMQDNFVSAEHLRKFALIRTGFCDSHTSTWPTKAIAQKVANEMRPIDEFSIVDVRGTTVTRFVAKSQSVRAMGKDEFMRSKKAVLDFVASLIGTSAQELEKQGEAA